MAERSVAERSVAERSVVGRSVVGRSVVGRSEDHPGANPIEEMTLNDYQTSDDGLE